MSNELNLKDAYALKAGRVYAIQCQRHLTPAEKTELSNQLAPIREQRDIEFILLPPGLSLAEVREEATNDLRTL